MKPQRTIWVLISKECSPLLFPTVLQTVQTTASPCENKREMGKHNQGHRGVSLEKHTKKNSISQHCFSSFPELRWKTVSSPC